MPIEDTPGKFAERPVARTVKTAVRPIVGRAKAGENLPSRSCGSTIFMVRFDFSGRSEISSLSLCHGAGGSPLAYFFDNWQFELNTVRSRERSKKLTRRFVVGYGSFFLGSEIA